MRYTCPACDGEGGFPPDFDTACEMCAGKGEVEGRPPEWPDVGSRLSSTAELLTFVVVEGEDYDLIAARCEQTGDTVRIRPDDVGTLYVRAEEEPAP